MPRTTRHPQRSQAVFVLFALLVLPAALPAEGAASEPLVGYWKGNIEVPGQPLEVIVELAREEAEPWSAKISIPVQAIRQAALVDVKIEGSAAAFRIDQIPGEPTFSGKLSEDANELAGDFTQAGQTFPFRLARSERPADADDDPFAEFTAPGVAGSGLAGHWNGVLEVGLQRLRLRLELARGEADTVGGAVVSLDQGNARIPVAAVTRAEDGGVSITFPAAQAGFEGKLSEDGAELEGSWKQGGRVTPLLFRRVAGKG